MNYENQPCPVCGQPLLATEDVVVCPDCATPQHRACWMKNGRCANAEKHGPEFLWTPDVRIPAPEHASAAGTVYLCPVCGSENPPDALHCGNCGALRGESGKIRCPYCGEENDAEAAACTACGALLSPGAGFPFFRSNPYVRDLPFEENETIGGRTVGDLALYVQQSSRRYLPKFKRFAEGKGISFNFAALIFAPYWFFYRKLYKAGAFFLILFAIVPLLLFRFTAQLNDVVTPYYELIQSGETVSEETAEAMLSEVAAQARTPLLVLGSANLALRLICALLADRLYYKKLCKDFETIDEQMPDAAGKKMLMMRRGGTSALLFLASLLAMEVLTQALYYIADIVAARLP